MSYLSTQLIVTRRDGSATTEADDKAVLMVVEEALAQDPITDQLDELAEPRVGSFSPMDGPDGIVISITPYLIEMADGEFDPLVALQRDRDAVARLATRVAAGLPDFEVTMAISD